MTNNDELEKELEARWKQFDEFYHQKKQRENKRRWKFDAFLIVLWFLTAIVMLYFILLALR